MPDTLTTNTVDELNTFPITLNDRWRVVDDPLQWVLQYRRRNMVLSGGSENPKSWGRETLLSHQHSIKTLHT